MKKLCFAIMTGAYISVLGMSMNKPTDDIHTVCATFYEAHDRGDGVYDVTAIAPATPEPDCGNFVYVGFYDDDPVWGMWDEDYKGIPDEEKPEFEAVINYNGNYEIINALCHDIPVEWR